MSIIVKLLLSNNEIWISFYSKWYNMILSENNVLLAHVPEVKYKKRSFDGVKSYLKRNINFLELKTKEIFHQKIKS